MNITSRNQPLTRRQSTRVRGGGESSNPTDEVTMEAVVGDDSNEKKSLEDEIEKESKPVRAAGSQNLWVVYRVALYSWKRVYSL